MATTVGTIQLLATIDTSQYKNGQREIEKSNDNIEKSAGSTSKRSNAAFNTIAKVGLAAVATAAIAAGAMIVKNIGGAIRRVDTLNNSTRTFENMGFEADETSRNMDELVKSITGLPTPLDSAVRGMQSLSATYGDIDRGRNTFTALNNAILGFGGTAAEVDNAINQLSQLPMDGPLDAQTWNSLRNSGLTPVLVAMAKDMGIGVDEMKKKFGEGELTVQDFTDRLMKMDKEGGGGMKSLEQIAKDATGGIGTGWQNMQTAITRGMADIIQSIGSENISAFITNLGSAFETSLQKMGAFFEFVIRNKNVFIPLTLAISTMIGLITAWFAITKIITVAQAILNATMLANPIGAIIVLIAGLVVAFLYLWNNVEGFRNFFITAWDMIFGAVTGVFNWVKRNWPLLLAILTGPIGLAVLAIIRNFDKIKNAARSVWNWIKNAFSTIGEIGAGIVKGAVNSVLGFAERTINGFINMVNSALDAINKVPGVNIGKIGTVSIPKLADGGIITRPTLAMVGEGNEAEAVIPLSKLDKMLSGDTTGGKYEPAGIVHRGEFVLPKEMVNQSTGTPKGGLGATIHQTNNIYNEVDMDRAMRDLAWRIAY